MPVAVAPELESDFPLNAMWTRERGLGLRGFDRIEAVGLWRERVEELKAADFCNFGKGVDYGRWPWRLWRLKAWTMNEEAAQTSGVVGFQLAYSANLNNYQFVHIRQAMTYLIVSLVLAAWCLITLDNKGNLIRPQQVSTSCQSLICWSSALGCCLQTIVPPVS